MKLIRGIAAALVLMATGVAATHAQSFAGGAVSAARAGFGLSIALGENELLIGEPNSSTRPGVIHVYRRGAAGWEAAGEITAPDAKPSDNFGQQIVLSGSTLFVGVPSAERNRGTVYVYQRGAAGWTPAGQLDASDLQGVHRFGSSIVAGPDIAFVSAPAREQGTGAVYAYERRAGGWERTATLTADSAVARSLFGNAIALAGDRLFVSSPALNQNRGAVTVFARNAQGAWASVGMLPAPELQANDRFGWALDASNNGLVVSAPATDDNRGVAYVYNRGADGTFTQQGRIEPAGITGTAVFGVDLAFDGTNLLVGAPAVDSTRGAVFHFTRAADGTFGAPVRITPAEPNPRQAGFGASIAVRGNVAAVALTGVDHGLGKVLVFEKTGPGWAQRAALMGPSDALASVTGGEVRCSEQGAAGQFGCRDVEMVSFLSIPDIGGGRGVRLNDVWGWTDPQTGREYALVGRIDGMSAVDVSNPSNPVYVANLPLTEGANPASWRDIKVYRDHAFIVADGSGPHGMQVLDLTKLRAFSGTPLELTADTIYRRVNSAHNIVINEESGFAYAVGASQGGETCGGGLHMIDIREPKNPTFAGCFSDPQTGRASTGYSHDAQCVMYHGPDARYQGREICLGSNETALSIADVTDKASPRALSRASYPSVGYSHQGWFDPQHRYFYMNDELDETSGLTQKTRTLVWDLADLEDPQLVTEHLGVEGSSDHNLYIIGDLMYQSNYKSGLRILDISDRENPREVAFFKTFPGEDATPGFQGSWSNYPYFGSGIIVVSSIGEGMFVLKKRDTKTVF